AERLRRVVHLRSLEGLGEVAAAGTEVRLVGEVRRGAVLGRQIADVHSGQYQRARGVAGQAARPHPAVQSGQIGRGAEDGAGRLGDVGVQRAGFVGAHGTYIRSGAETPSSPRALASTTRVAAHSHSRAVVRSLAGSS